MSATTRRAVRIRKPMEEVAAIATDPRVVLPIVGGLGRFQALDIDDEGCGDWDIFIDVGSIHVGGRVVVERPDGYHLAWRSIRGTRHQLELSCEFAGDDTEVAIEMSVQLAGFLFGYVAERMAAGIMARHIDAGLQQLRHHIEFGE
jgi:uncharacterized membrane protein